MELGILGSGKVAFQLGQALFEAGHSIRFIFGRNQAEVQHLAKKVNSIGSTNFEELELESLGLIIIAVNDDSIPKVAELVPHSFTGILAHTSGAQGMIALGESPIKKGIFYPLYSFRNKRKHKFLKIPILISGENQAIEKELFELAKSISKNQYSVNDEDRAKLHLAAVYANNFSNHMMSLCFDLLEDNGLDKEILLPIIKQSAETWSKGKAKRLQTGPAIRNDQETMHKHVESISDPEQKELYKIISESIAKFHS